MKMIKAYFVKIDDIINKKQSKKTKPKSNSFLSPLQKEEKTTNKDLTLVAEIVEGIREARAEMMNGR
jgi:hypothetical protein